MTEDMLAHLSLNLQRLSTVELRQICYFLAIVAEGNNFSRAAEVLQIEQPPLSQRIRALEKMLKVELFDRRHRPLQLTRAGRFFLEDAQLALLHLDRAITQARRANQGKIGEISVGIASSIANSVLPDVLRAFRDRCPDVKLELRELTAEQQIQALRDRRLDAGFETVLAHHQDPSLCAMPVVQEVLMVALPDDHPLTAHPQVTLQDLADQPVILPAIDAFPFYEAFIQRCEQVGFQPQIVQTAKATWFISIVSLVAAGIGLAILPSNFLNLQRRGVVYRLIEDANLIKQISVIWHRENASPTLREFLKVVQDVVHRQNPFSDSTQG